MVALTHSNMYTHTHRRAKREKQEEPLNVDRLIGRHKLLHTHFKSLGIKLLVCLCYDQTMKAFPGPPTKSARGDQQKIHESSLLPTVDFMCAYTHVSLSIYTHTLTNTQVSSVLRAHANTQNAVTHTQLLCPLCHINEIHTHQLTHIAMSPKFRPPPIILHIIY